MDTETDWRLAANGVSQVRVDSRLLDIARGRFPENTLPNTALAEAGLILLGRAPRAVIDTFLWNFEFEREAERRLNAWEREQKRVRNLVALMDAQRQS